MVGRTRFVVIALAALAIGATAALALTLSRIGDLRDEAADLKDRIARLRALVEAQPADARGNAPAVDWRSLQRRLERLERFAESGEASAGPAVARAPALGANRALDVKAATRGDEVAGSPSGAPGADVLQTDQFRSGLKEMLKSGVKQTLTERRQKWFERYDQRMRAEVNAFGKQQNLDAAKVDQMTSIVQDDRDQRREIRRQLRQNEIDVGAARREVDTLNAATKARIVETVGEAGYEAYRQKKQEQRQVWRSLRHF